MPAVSMVITETAYHIHLRQCNSIRPFGKTFYEVHAFNKL